MQRGRPGAADPARAGKARRVAGFLACLIALSAASQLALAAPDPPADPEVAGVKRSGKLSPALRALSAPAAPERPLRARAQAAGVELGGPGSPLRRGSRLVVDVRADPLPRRLPAKLRRRGAEVLNVSRRYETVTAAVAPDQLRPIARIAAVDLVIENLTPIVWGKAGGPRQGAARRAACFGARTSEGDVRLRAAEARTAFGVDGSGVDVGLLSDSYDRKPTAVTHAAGDVLSGDLPGLGNLCGKTTPVSVLEEGPVYNPTTGSPADEGRAMAQIVHDLAPGARLSFASAFNGHLSFAANIRALATAGADVIVDDVSYLDEPFFQEGPIAVAVNDVTAAGVTYYSSAGNANVNSEATGTSMSSWEAPAYREAGSCPSWIPPSYAIAGCMDFDPGTAADSEFTIRLKPNDSFRMVLQWAQPWYGVTTDLDLFVQNCSGSNLTTSTFDNPGSTKVPVEYLTCRNTTGANRSVQVAIGRYAGPATPRLKFIQVTNGTTSREANEYPVSAGGDVVGPAIFGHNGGSHTISVAASDQGVSPTTVEPYSSRGPVTHYFAPVTSTTPAAPLAQPQVLAKPDLTASDNTQNTFFGTQFALPGGGSLYRFRGTSAAAPHAAAVAALALEASPGSAPATIRTAQVQAAQPIAGASSQAAGAGLVDAVATLAALPDVVPPDTSIDSGPSGPTTNPQPSFTFSSDEAGATFACSLVAAGQPAAFAACASPYSPSSVLADGAYSFSVRAADQAGNVDPTPATRSFTVDTAAPDTSISSGPAEGSVIAAATASFTYAGSPPGDVAAFECQLDGAAFASCPAAGGSYSSLADGAHTFRVRAIDAAGNVDPSPAIRSFTVDTTPPETTITSGPADEALIATPSASFAFTASEPGSSFECRLDGAAFGACSSPSGYPGLADGPHTIRIRAIDPVGNVDPTPAIRTFVVDTTAPETSIDGGPAAGSTIADPTPTLSFSSTESGSSFACRLDDGSFESCASPLTTAELADGSHSFEVVATDPAGNADPTPASRSFTVDATPPATTINSGPAGTIGQTQAGFTFSSNEPGSIFECRLDGGAFTACSSPRQVSDLADGPHGFEVRAIDAAGNVDPTPALRTFTVDTAPPETTIDSGPAQDAAVASNTVTFQFSASESPATFQCSLDLGAFTSCASPIVIGPIADGAHSLRVRALDAVGNVDSTPATRGFTIDTTPPETTIDSGPPPGGTTSDRTPQLSFLSSEPGSTFTCSVDGADFASCDSPVTLAELADGPHTFRARAIDPAGNTDPSAAQRSFTVDGHPPETSIDSGPAEGVTIPSAATSISFSADEPGSTFECRLDDGVYQPCTSPRSLNGLADGGHAFRVRATDAAGNTDATPALRGFSVDTTPPETTIESGPEQGQTIAIDHAEYEFTANEPGATFECRLDSGTFSACTSPNSLIALSEGTHTIAIRAVDLIGNVDPTPASRTFVVDTTQPDDQTAPDTSIISGPGEQASVATASVEFGFASSEPGSRFECSLDSADEASYGSCYDPWSYSGLSNGPHVFRVRAIDTSDNVDPTPASRNFVVDTTEPDTSIDSGPADGALLRVTVATFGFSSNEAGSTFECSRDGGAFSPCTPPLLLSELADGAHSVSVRAVDSAGNLDPTPASRGFTIDTTPPETTIDSGPAAGGATSDRTPQLAFSSNEPGSTFSCSIDGADFAPCDSPVTLAELADGPHTFRARAIDPAGNPDQSADQRSFTVDGDPPETAIDSGPAPGAMIAVGSASFTFSADEPGAAFECEIDEQGFEPCSSPRALTGLGDGPHRFDVRAIDAAGNVDPTPASRSLTVDTVAPNTTFTAGPQNNALLATDSATFGFASPDPSATFECSADGGTFVACTSPRTISGLGDGPHTFDVRAIDPAGNADPTPAGRMIIVDTQPPETSFSSGPTDGATIAIGSPSFGFGASEAATFECSVDGGGFASCVSPRTLLGLADGSHAFAVRAADAAGNVDSTPAARQFTVDTAPPDTAISAGPQSGSRISDPTPTFEFSGEPGASYECRVDSASFGACSSPHTTSSLADGSHSFEVRAIDAAGNVDPSPDSRSFTVDTVPPATTIDSGPSGGSAQASSKATFTFSSDDPEATFGCSLDGAGFTACESPFVASGLAEGAHSFRVQAIDLAGNADPTPGFAGFVVDLTPPETSITSPVFDGMVFATPSPAFAFGSTDGSATFQCRFDSASFEPCSSPFQPSSPLGDGAHSFQVRAVDAAGNADPTPASRQLTIDTAVPETTIVSGPANGAAIATPELSFEFSSADPEASFECRIDDGEFAFCASPAQLGPLEDGEHTFRVRAIDAAQNADPTPATRTFRVDTQAPETTIDPLVGPVAGQGDGDRAFAFSSDEDDATFECRLDSRPFTACTSRKSYSSLASGNHVFRVRAIDAAGNVDPTPAFEGFEVIDRKPPQTKITTGPRGVVSGPKVEFEFTATELGHFECSLDGAPYRFCRSPRSYRPGAGRHQLRVRAVDRSGNRDPSPASRSFKVRPS